MKLFDVSIVIVLIAMVIGFFTGAVVEDDKDFINKPAEQVE